MLKTAGTTATFGIEMNTGQNDSVGKTTGTKSQIGIETVRIKLDGRMIFKGIEELVLEEIQ